MYVDEDRPTREQLDASWDETFERLRTVHRGPCR